MYTSFNYRHKHYHQFLKNRCARKTQSCSIFVSLLNNIFAGGADIILFYICFWHLILRSTLSVNFLRTSVKAYNYLLTFTDAFQCSETFMQVCCLVHITIIAYVLF